MWRKTSPSTPTRRRCSSPGRKSCGSSPGSRTSSCIFAVKSIRKLRPARSDGCSRQTNCRSLRGSGFAGAAGFSKRRGLRLNLRHPRRVQAHRQPVQHRPASSTSAARAAIRLLPQSPATLNRARRQSLDRTEYGFDFCDRGRFVNDQRDFAAEVQAERRQRQAADDRARSVDQHQLAVRSAGRRAPCRYAPERPAPAPAWH